MILYSAFLSMAPFILLAVTKGAFGPLGIADDEWQTSYLWDLTMVLMVIVGAIVSVLVLGDVLSATPVTKWIVVVAGVVALLLLAVHMFWSVTTRYRRTSARGRSPRSR